MGKIKKLQFPTDLLSDNVDNSGRYGNEFMIMYINERSLNSEPYVNTNGTPLVKDLDGKPLRNFDGPVVDTFFSATTGGRIKSVPMRTTYAIFLPVPLNIKSDYSVAYEDFAAEEEALKLAKTGIESLAKMGSKGAAIKGGAKGAIVGAAIANIPDIIGNVAKFGGVALGQSINPHKELLFKAVNLRSFTFDYTLIANNAAESDTIKELVNLLRYHMHPDLSALSALFEYPSEFDCEFYICEKSKDGTSSSYRRNPYLPFMSTCVIENLTIDVSSNNNYVSFKETYAPVEYKISIKLKETQIMTKENINTFNMYIDQNVSTDMLKLGNLSGVPGR